MVRANTPIELAIAGEPLDRRRRWDQRMKKAGYKRVNLWVPADEVALIKEIKALLASGDPTIIDELKQFFRVSYEAWMLDAGEPAEDRAFARDKFLDLGGDLPPERD